MGEAAGFCPARLFDAALAKQKERKFFHFLCEFDAIEKQIAYINL